MTTTPKPSVRFPEVLALYNPVATNGFKMSFKAPLDISSTVEIPKNGQRTKILDHSVMTKVLDTLFVHRFYARLVEGTLPDDAMLKIKLDGGVVAEDSLSSFYLPPLLDIETPYKWKKTDKFMMFPAVGFQNGHGFLNEQRGIMLPNGVVIEAFLDPGTVTGPAKLEVGLVCATYTAEGDNGVCKIVEEKK